MCVVFLGGFLGTVARYGIGLVVPRPAGLPLPDTGGQSGRRVRLGDAARGARQPRTRPRWRRPARLHFGTGFLRAFTTYSALAADAVLLASGGRIAASVFYLVMSIICGAALTAVGISVGAKRR